MKKPKVFANPIDKKINNNQEFFEANNSIDNITELLSEKVIEENYLYQQENDYQNLTVLEKIDKLLNRNGYIFNVEVKIITKEKKYQTKIAGKVNNHIITLDNDIININDIIDLKIK